MAFEKRRIAKDKRLTHTVNSVYDGHHPGGDPNSLPRRGVYLIESPWQMQGMCLFKEAIHFIIGRYKSRTGSTRIDSDQLGSNKKLKIK